MTTRIAAVLLFASLQGCVSGRAGGLVNGSRSVSTKRLTLNPFVRVSVWGIYLSHSVRTRLGPADTLIGICASAASGCWRSRC